MGVGTPDERFAAKFCAESRLECPEIFYGDPFGEIFGLFLRYKKVEIEGAGPI